MSEEKQATLKDKGGRTSECAAAIAYISRESNNAWNAICREQFAVVICFQELCIYLKCSPGDEGKAG